MKMRIAHYFPHFSRFFTAPATKRRFHSIPSLLEKAFFVLIIGIITLHTIAVRRAPVTSPLKEELLKNPYDIGTQTTLTHWYYTQHYGQKLDEQLALITWLNQFNRTHTDVLGTSTKSDDQIVALHTALAKRTQQITFWEQFMKEHPDYRNGYLILAELYVLEDDRYKAQSVVEKARIIDPNNQMVQQFAELVQ